MDSQRMPRRSASYAVLTASHSSDRAGSGGGSPESRPELADVGRLARRLMHRAVSAARVQDDQVRLLLREHLGPDAAGIPVVSGSWPRYDHVNVQAGVDAWLAEEGREHKLVGLTGFRHMMFGLADLGQTVQRGFPLGVGSVAMAALPSGPAGQTRPCVQCGLYLISDAETRVAILLRGSDDHHGPSEGVSIEVLSADQSAAERALAEIRHLTVERNVWRGHVVSFGGEVFEYDRDELLSFVERPRIDRSEVILPPDVLSGIERQVLGVARYAKRLLASGQHLKRGVLLHGAPGTGKTHTVRYLLGQLPGVTVVILSGSALGLIAEACSVARTLQPSMVVIEDVDLIAEERDSRMGEHPLLFQLLNEMDGLGADIDVTFLLTTNRADLLEEALAARPGRVDHAAELPLPDGEARRRLIQLYRGSLVLDLTDPDAVIARTEGVTASFLKELLRRAALVAAEETPDADGPLRVADSHLSAALDQLLDSRSRLTRILLGSHTEHGSDAVIRPGRLRQ